MSKQSFSRALQQVEGHPVFGTAYRPQSSAVLQLLVALTNFGVHGNGAAVGRIARSFGVSGLFVFCHYLTVLTYLSHLEGSVQNFTKRSVVAILS